MDLKKWVKFCSDGCNRVLNCTNLATLPRKAYMEMRQKNQPKYGQWGLNLADLVDLAQSAEHCQLCIINKTL